MKRILIYIVFILIFFVGCASPNLIYHIIKPVKNHKEKIEIHEEKAVLEKNNIKVSLEPIYGKKLEIFKNIHEGFSDGKEPLLLMFRIYIENKNKTRIIIPLEKIVLLDD